MSDTKAQIVALLKKQMLKPVQISKKLKLSRQALHRHLKVLLEQKQIEKQGAAPNVFYSHTSQKPESRVQESAGFFKKNLLPNYFKELNIDGPYKSFYEACKPKSRNMPDFAFMVDSAAVYSSNIEGNTLNLNSFLNSRSLTKKLRPKEAREIEDLVAAYSFSQNLPLNEANLKKAHAILSKDFVNKARQGIYRMESVGVFSNRGIEYLAIEAQYLNNEMSEFFEVISDLLTIKLSVSETFFWASWLHLMMALIHPFSDGNGRIARLCEKWFLIQKLGPQMVFLPSEEHYFKLRPEYYSALRIGPNYWEVNFGITTVFLKLLPGSLKPLEKST